MALLPVPDVHAHGIMGDLANIQDVPDRLGQILPKRIRERQARKDQ